MSFHNTPMAQAACAELRAHHDLRFMGERVLISWLTEFGYLAYPSPENLRRAFHIARHERGGAQLARELNAHEHRVRNRDDMRASAEWIPCRT